MRLLFRQVQTLDGFKNTQPNADGILAYLMIATSGATANFIDPVGAQQSRGS